MKNKNIINYISGVIKNHPTDWLRLTTHRLDIYTEKLAKNEFLEGFEKLYLTNNFTQENLSQLPTAYDYIRLGHPLSSVLEWTLAKSYNLPNENVISFSSSTVPILAVLRKNLFLKKNTRIAYTNKLPSHFNELITKKVYGYNFELYQTENIKELPSFDGSTILLNDTDKIYDFNTDTNADFIIQTKNEVGSILIAKDPSISGYAPEIQHVRRRETIAMTPENCLITLQALVENKAVSAKHYEDKKNLTSVEETLKNITGTSVTPLVASSGLSMQYGIMMGLVHHALENHPGKPIRFIVPPNCYGGTNDQARRVAACLDFVEIEDLPVDGGYDMVSSTDSVLEKLAKEDAVPYIIAEIPTNPRVEVPDLVDLKNALSKERTNSKGETAIPPVFILDQTFCPNVKFLGEGQILSGVRSISYASGSKFPSGGKCTSGYCVADNEAADLMDKINLHLTICDNKATSQQLMFLAEQLPSMLDRIKAAYLNTRDFVEFVEETLPNAKINFVSEELAAQGFTPSVFSLDLPTKGNSEEEKEAYKRELNLKLINLMINEIPTESKFCVSYGQLKGCYWTIPATSTQGTTKEVDKDYIVRVALSSNMDLDKHKEVFTQFVNEL